MAVRTLRSILLRELLPAFAPLIICVLVIAIVGLWHACREPSFHVYGGLGP
jgi:hypothetical protein